MKLTRRELHKLVLVSAGAIMLPASFGASATALFPDIRLGANTFCFRDMSRSEAIAAMRNLGINACELYFTHVFFDADQPPPKHWLRLLLEDRDKLRDWRLSAPKKHFEAIRRQFEKAGIELFLYRSAVPDNGSDEELEREFLFAKWLGVPALSTQLQPEMVGRFASVAERHNIKLALHNTTSLFRRVQNVPAFPDEIVAQLKVSPLVCLSLDIGHFFAAGNDPVAFIKKYHKRIINIQLKDRKHAEGPNMPCGKGDAPIGEVIRLVRDNKWSMSMVLELEHDPEDVMAEMRQCVSYAENALKL